MSTAAELPVIAEVMSDPGTSPWLRDALSTALRRDPVEACRDAELLTVLLKVQAGSTHPADLAASPVHWHAEGALARRQGLTLEACRYRPGTAGYIHWMRGYADTAVPTDGP